MTNQDRPEVPGNVLATMAQVDRIMHSFASAVYKADGYYLGSFPDNFRPKLLKFKAPAVSGGEWLCIITAWVMDEPVVAFVSGPDFPTTLKVLCTKLTQGSLDWRRDEYSK